MHHFSKLENKLLIMMIHKDDDDENKQVYNSIYIYNALCKDLFVWD